MHVSHSVGLAGGLSGFSPSRKTGPRGFRPFPLQVPCEVNGSALAVVELQLDQVATPIDSRNNVVQHSAIPSGEACRSVPHPRASVVDHHSRCGLSDRMAISFIMALESLSTVGSTSRFGSSSSAGRPQIGRPLSSEVANTRDAVGGAKQRRQAVERTSKSSRVGRTCR